MKLKRTLSLALAMIMLITCFSGVTITAYARDKSKTIDGIGYTYVIKNNEAKITNIYTEDDNRKSKELVIPEKLGGVKVTTIGNRALGFVGEINSIKLGNTVETLERGALWRGSDVSISIGSALKTLNDGAINPAALKSITVSKSNKNFCVKDNALYNKDKTVLYLYCGKKSGSSFTVPSTVTEIKPQAFSGTKLSTIKLSSKLTKIGSHAFSGTKIKSMTLPKSVTALGYGAFCSCYSLKSVDLSKTQIKSIEKLTFAYSDKISSLKLPSTVTSIGEDPFACVKLSNFTLPKNIKTIDVAAFSHADIKSFKLDKKNKSFTTVDGVLFNKSKTTLVAYPSGKSTKSYSIPSGTEKINDYAFAQANTVKSITAPKTVTKIGYDSFAFCSKLESIDLSKTKIKSVASASFENTRKLSTVKIPSSCTKIEKDAFMLSGVSSINFPKSLTKIENMAFYACKKLKSADLSSTNIEKLGASSFLYSGLKSVKLPTCCTTIGKNAFADTQLESIKFPKKLKKIESMAFESCRKLQVVDLSNTVVEKIEGEAFYCSGVKTVKLPATLTKLESAFAYCDNLSEVYIYSDDVKIADGAFYNYNWEKYDDETGNYSIVYPFTIYANSGSSAEAYASDKNITFVAM